MLAWLKQLQVNSRAHHLVRAKKDALFLPIAKGLHKLGVTPDMVTWAGAALGLLSLPLLWVGYGWFVLAVAVSLLFDGIDGSLARYTKTENQTGEQLDHIVDTALMFLMVSALALWLQQPLWIVGINWHVALLLLNWLLGSPINIAPGRAAFLILLLFNNPPLMLVVYFGYAAVLTIAIPITWYKRKVSPSQL